MSRRRPLRLSTSKMHAELRVNATCGCKARPLVKWDGHPRCHFHAGENGEKLFVFPQKTGVSREKTGFLASFRNLFETRNDKLLRAMVETRGL